MKYILICGFLALGGIAAFNSFLLLLILKKQIKMANELETLEQEVAETGTVMASAIVLLEGLKAKLDAAGTDPVKLKALSDSLDTNTNALATAITANTPAEDPPAE